MVLSPERLRLVYSQVHFADHPDTPERRMSEPRLCDAHAITPRPLSPGMECRYTLKHRRSMNITLSGHQSHETTHHLTTLGGRVAGTGRQTDTQKGCRNLGEG